MSDFPITTQGFKKLQDELTHLKQVVRPDIVKAIASAREHGDLKENAEYHAAREKQSFTEGKILDLEDKVSRALVIDPSTITDSKVRFAATVKLFDLDSEKELSYTLVSEYEADIENNLISITSPLALSLIGKETGDEAIVKTPMGQKSYEVMEISYDTKSYS